MSIELLAPAGSPEALDAAVGEGADAVYLGLKNFNARMRSANFTYAQFEAALRSLRRMGKKLYVTVNTVFEQREADRMYQLLKYLSSAGPDALIVQDFGVLAMVRSEFPQLKLHASTQMNIACGRGANMLSRYGVSRVVLARELSLEELRSIRSETNMELEIFVHGSLCVSVSGLCLFSGYLGGKSANRGMCTQACRRLYHRGEDAGGAAGGVAGGVTENGYYFSPADLQLLEHLPDLAAAGINSLKIEGRMKSADYVGAVVSAYRLVLDAMSNGGALEDNEEKIRRSIAQGQNILRGDFARRKTIYFFNADNSVNWLNPAQDGGTGISLGVIVKVQGKAGQWRALVCDSTMSNAAGMGLMPVVGDSIRLHRSDDSERVSHKVIYAEAAADGLTTGGSTTGFWLSVPDGFNKDDRVYLIQTKTMSKRHKPVIAHNAGTGGRAPGHEKAPSPPAYVPRKIPQQKNKSAVFPDGLYVAVSCTNDLYIVQSSRPARVMVSLTRKTVNYLLGEDKPPLPFKPAEIILVLEPFFPQAAAEELAGIIRPLVDKGYRQFTVNNLGHFSLFRDMRPDVQLIAGPWLYTFNAWALSYVLSLGIDSFVSPLENNRQNWERTTDTGNHQIPRSMAFVPVFAWPPLFHIRADLGPLYDFTAFSDNRGESFSLVCGPEGSTVFPEKPFSIIDKIPFLKEAGFRRFIIDVAGNFPGGRPLKKTDYKDLMRAADNGTPLPRISRFNWKNGFYNMEEANNKEQIKPRRTRSTTEF